MKSCSCSSFAFSSMQNYSKGLLYSQHGDTCCRTDVAPICASWCPRLPHVDLLHPEIGDTSSDAPFCTCWSFPLECRLIDQAFFCCLTCTWGSLYIVYPRQGISSVLKEEAGSSCLKTISTASFAPWECLMITPLRSLLFSSKDPSLGEALFHRHSLSPSLSGPHPHISLSAVLFFLLS